MIELLNKIRKPDKKINIKKEIVISFFILSLGIGLGIISKWLDSRSFNSVILNHLDLGNFFSDYTVWLFIALTISIFSHNPLKAAIDVFLFFVGMVVSYHLCTVLFVGFNPTNYMKIWYTLTILSPILAYICWYAKSTHKLSIVLDSIIIFVMLHSCFSIGLVYFDFKGILYTLVFVSTVIVLYKDFKNLSISLLIGLLLSFIIRNPLNYIY